MFPTDTTIEKVRQTLSKDSNTICKILTQKFGQFFWFEKVLHPLNIHPIRRYWLSVIILCTGNLKFQFNELDARTFPKLMTL